MTDIVEELRRKVFRGPTMEASHTKTVEWKAADEIERLRAALQAVIDAYYFQNPFRKADMHRHDCKCLRCAVDNARAALEAKDD